MAFSKSVLRSQMPINCNLCETERSIKWKCLTCGVLMCSTCKDKIHLRIGKDHKVVDIKDVGQPGEELDFKNIICQEHSEQSSCLFCTNCDTLVCPSCVAKIHKKHDLIEISDAYNLKIDKLKKKHSQLQKKKDEIAATKDQLNKFQNAENSNYAKVRTELLNHEKVLKEAVEKYISKLRNELDQNHNTFSKVNEECINAVSKSENQVEKNYRDVQGFLDTTDIIKFFLEVNRIERSTEVLVPKPGTSSKTTLQFIPAEITQTNIGVLQGVDIPLPEVKVSLRVVHQYQTNISVISCLTSWHDDSMWISCNSDEVIQKVKPGGTNLKTISTFKIKINGMVKTTSDDLLLGVMGKSRLQMISNTTGKVTDTVYGIHPFLPTAIHITSGGQVIVGGYHKERRGAVFVINKNGDHEAVYEHDKHNQPIFSYPRNITTASNGNIYVADYTPKEECGKVVVLRNGNVINIYKGDSEINKEVPFTPAGIVTTPRDNVIVVDVDNDTLHILNNSGHLITYIKTTDNGLEGAFSITFTPTGQLYIGCTKQKSSTTKEAKLYEVNISGC